MFDPIKRNDRNNRPLSINGGLNAMSAQPRTQSPRVTNMLDRVNDLVADTTVEIAKLAMYHPDRPALIAAKLALQQAQRELTTL